MLKGRINDRKGGGGGVCLLWFSSKFSLNEIRSFLFKIFFREFRCIFEKSFDLIFAKFSFNFNTIEIKMFPFRIKKIVYLRKYKILNERSKIS